MADSDRAFSLNRRTLLIGSCACFGCMLPGYSFAEAPIAGNDSPGFYRLMVGDFEVMAISDGRSVMDAGKLLIGDKAAISGALKSNFLAEEVPASHNAFLVNTGQKLVLIDTGGGSLIGPRFGKLSSNLVAAGYKPAQVDEVLLTHLHADHVGGLMTGSNKTFPNATVRADKRDADYWLSEQNKRKAPAEAQGGFDAAMTSLSAYQRDGQLKTFDGPAQLMPGVAAKSAYGHTPGHTMFEIESKGEKLLLWGDIVHVAAVQFYNPTVTISYDSDKAEAEREHFKVMGEVAENRTMIGGAHLPFPGLGHIRPDGKDRFDFVPLV